MPKFQLKHYGEDAASWPAQISYPVGTESAIKARAGRMSVAIKGPVDIAYAGSAPWADRYITTASPSEYHASGYRFERIA